MFILSSVPEFQCHLYYMVSFLCLWPFVFSFVVNAPAIVVCFISYVPGGCRKVFVNRLVKLNICGTLKKKKI